MIHTSAALNVLTRRMTQNGHIDAKEICTCELSHPLKEEHAQADPDKVTWGRSSGRSNIQAFSALAMMLLTPVLTFYCWIACTHDRCASLGPLLRLWAVATQRRSPLCDMMTFRQTIIASIYFRRFSSILSCTSFTRFVAVCTTLYDIFPTASWHLSAVYVCWLGVQGLLYQYLPGPTSLGQVTPAGKVLAYKTNGLNAYLLTHVLFIMLSSFSPIASLRLFPASFIASNFGAFLVAANAYGFVLTGLAYAKARLSPTHPEDCKLSGSILYDLFMGIEFNPRFGKRIVNVRGVDAELGWDFKLFHNGRIGIIAWTLINLSFAALQFEQLGRVTNALCLVSFLQAIYVIDFFYHENWYLRTVDIAHDHFGYYLAWGDACWLPFMYTLQCQYLYQNPTDLTNGAFCFTMILGLSGYYIFRSANNQKDLTRATNGDCQIWGKKPNLLRLRYRTADNKTHISVLLVDGFWKVARQSNYLGDIMLSLAYCLTCPLPFLRGPAMSFLYRSSLTSMAEDTGTSQPEGSLLSYFYIIFMLILLIHRVERTDERCRSKYKEGWDIYTSLVPYKIFPGLY